MTTLSITGATVDVKAIHIYLVGGVAVQVTYDCALNDASGNNFGLQTHALNEFSVSSVVASVVTDANSVNGIS